MIKIIINALKELPISLFQILYTRRYAHYSTYVLLTCTTTQFLFQFV